MAAPAVAPPPAAAPARLDKWLWMVRIFRTRSLAGDACRAGSVTVNDHPAKPAREVRPGEQVSVRDGLVTRTLRVVASPRGRVAARWVPEFCVETTPESEWAKAREAGVRQLLAREQGSGRPTKRDRRLLDRLFE
ncbi:MAG: hypothetical protein B9S27_08625 [Opitutia bacterium Tous-C8FEB]|nr:MAG: hypothetical protein B9S27_08625 [Opitutae bacterium Tous-C8FEB]